MMNDIINMQKYLIYNIYRGFFVKDREKAKKIKRELKSFKRMQGVWFSLPYEIHSAYHSAYQRTCKIANSENAEIIIPKNMKMMKEIYDEVRSVV